MNARRAGERGAGDRASPGLSARRPPRTCPVCGDDLAVTRLSCGECASELSGLFAACELCGAGDDDREMLRVFLASRGNMRALAAHLGVSYPTARARFDALLTRLGIEQDSGDADRETVLASLAAGDIDVDEALRRL